MQPSSGWHTPRASENVFFHVDFASFDTRSVWGLQFTKKWYLESAFYRGLRSTLTESGVGDLLINIHGHGLDAPELHRIADIFRIKKLQNLCHTIGCFFFRTHTFINVQEEIIYPSFLKLFSARNSIDVLFNILSKKKLWQAVNRQTK